MTDELWAGDARFIRLSHRTRWMPGDAFFFSCLTSWTNHFHLFILLSEAVPDAAKAMKSACHLECRHGPHRCHTSREARSDSGMKSQMFVPGGVMQSDKAAKSGDWNGRLEWGSRLRLQVRA